MIPADWTIEPLGELVEYDSGRTPARANPVYWEGDDATVPWVAISDMENYGTISKTREMITRRALDDIFRQKMVPSGTLLMSFKLTIGRIATLGIDACHNEAIISVRPKARLEQRYLGYFLSQFDYDDLQDRQIKGNTLNRDKIDRLPVVLPPRQEQCDIADVLDRVRQAITLEAKAAEVASSLKRAAMQHLFTKGLRGEAQKETSIGPLPESWDVVPLGQHYSAVSGGTPSRDNPSFWQGGTIPWVKTTEVNYGLILRTEEHITEAGLNGSAAKWLPAGTLLIAMYGQGVTRGRVAVLGIDATCNQACAALNSLDGRVELFFLFYFLSWRYEEIRELAHGGQQQNLNLDIVRELLIVRPPSLDEQREIVAILDAIEHKIDLHKRKRAVLEDLFKALLHKLMSCEIRVGDLDLSALGKAPLEEVAA